VSPHVPLPVLADATHAWALDTVQLVAAEDPMAGGAAVADLNGDGPMDLLIATARDVDDIVWGGAWLDTNAEPDQLDLASPGQPSGLLAGELSGDDLIDIVRLGRGMGDPEPDVLWVASADRTFLPTELAVADRFSLAAGPLRMLGHHSG
jgi:hypothetical protein